MSDVQATDMLVFFPNARRLAALAAKRGIDVVGAGAGLALLAVPLALLCLVIWLTGGGAPLFRQERDGLYGQRFRIFKLRTMARGRVTALGALLRRTSLDELPQLWNVLLGDMSLVGPRPHIPSMSVGGIAYGELVPNYTMRLAMRPGLTGLAQVNGLRGPVRDAGHAEQRIACDLAYIRRFSLVLDIVILWRSLQPKVFMTRNW